jgi:hypothetical protein
MLAKGDLGCLFEAKGVPVAPIVLGLVLGPFLEQNFMISAIVSDWDLSGHFTRPVSGPLGRVDRSCLVLLPADSFVRSLARCGSGRECARVTEAEPAIGDDGPREKDAGLAGLKFPRRYPGSKSAVAMFCSTGGPMVPSA